MVSWYMLATFVAGLVTLADGSPMAQLKQRDVPNTHVLHERGLPHWERSWFKKDRVPSNALLPMRIGLKQSNLHLGHEILMDISNPNSPNFGNHMTAEEVIEMFSPPKDAVKAVMNWVVSSGIAESRVSQSANKQWVQFDASATEAESLLFTDYYVFEHRQTGTKNVACEEYHIPADVRELVDYITPGIRLRPDPKKVKEINRRDEIRQFVEGVAARTMHTELIRISNAEAAALPPLTPNNCNLYVTPQCVRTQYNVSEGTKAATGNELGIYESLNDHYSKADLDNYFSTVYPKIPKGTYPIERLIDGAIGAATSSSQVGGESDLDFQAAYPLIWPQQAVLFQTDDQYYEINMTDPHTPYLGFFNTFLDAVDGSYCNSTAYGQTGNCQKKECLDPIYPNPNPGGYKGALQCGVYKPTNVISISYGGGEADVPDYYNKRQCDEILKLSLQGVTVVVSSGDSGVGSVPNDGGWPTGCAGQSGRVFFPSSAATCPYVLAVGSTQWENATSSSRWTAGTPLPESATTSFPSGGGFSNHFSVADYQKDAVAGYFDSVKLPFTGYADMGTNFSTVGTGVYHTGGRGYPDVSAIGDRYVVRWNGSWSLIGGTSLSAPIWAAILTLINEERIAAGKKPIGFVNPILYQHPEVFNDITKGSNPACRSTGFSAAPGWDPVTGLGTPNFPKLLKLLVDA